MGDVMRCAKIRFVVRIRIPVRYICMVRIIYDSEWDENCVPWENAPCENCVPVYFNQYYDSVPLPALTSDPTEHSRTLELTHIISRDTEVHVSGFSDLLFICVYARLSD